MRFLIFGILLVPQVTLAQNRMAELSHIFSQYGERFVDGKYNPDVKKATAFTELQETFVSRMKSEGALTPLLTVTNSFNTSLWVKLWAHKDEKNHLLSIYWEKSKYFDAEERSYLRFLTFQRVSEGVKFIPVLKSHALHVKGYYLNREKGGTLQFIFLQNLKNNSWMKKDLFLLFQDNTWKLFNTNMKAVASAHVEVWTSLFPPNGGVQDVLIK